MRRSVLSVLVTAAAVAALAVPAQASPAPQHAAPAAAAAKVRTFTNPLDLRLPGGGRAASCADPTTAHGTGSDHHWYLYCTSDALSETEQDASGALVQHLLPTYRSTDLVHWTYTGDALRTRPSWADPDAGLYAPEVLRSGRTWYLYYAVSKTTTTGLGGDASAIGVLTGPSPVGPWTDAGKPVVPPAANPTDPGDYRATIDPEVISSGGSRYLYFGSYPGGVFVRRLTANGLGTVASSERRISIANRYEGTNIVRHGGWWWFLGSATNCCNAGLTGYGVFAARSKSPFGPFRDADGHSILEARVGGTPVLAQNGNRWIGTGHETVLTDAAGQDWMVYHAVDRTDPTYAGSATYTKRPVLMDRLTWVHGWPVVRGGRGPSDTPQPAPAAQPGQRDAPAPSAAQPLRPGRTIPALSDSFSGTALAKRWTFVRPPAAGTVRVADGRLAWDTQAADLHPPTTPLASVLTEPSPSGDWVAEAELRTTVPATGDSFNYAQGGLIVYGDDGHYVKLSDSSIFETRQTEFGIQDGSGPATPPADPSTIAPTYGNGVGGPVGSGWTRLRIVRHRVEGHVAYTAQTSVDGRTWRTAGTWTTDLGAHPRIGLVSLGGAGFTTLVDRVTVSRLG